MKLKDVGGVFPSRATSGRYGVKRFLVIPGASAFVPHLCSLVIPAGTLDPAPSGGKSSYRLFF